MTKYDGMKANSVIGWLLALFVGGLAFSVITAAQTTGKAATPASQPAPAATQFFPVAEVKPGMRAVGYTVFNGSEPRKFELEILGVLKGFQYPQQDAILSKLLGAEFQHIGVFQGMSGSPVYIDGKLLGAVAFGYQFAKDPIAGITPIGDMIGAFEQRQSESQSAPDKPRAISFAEIAFHEDAPAFKQFVESFSQAAQTQAARTVNAAGATPALLPITTPLAIAGVAAEIVAKFAPHFQALGLNPVAGAAGAAPITELKKASGDTLKPGATIVVPLVRGDVSVAAAGTVTWRDGNRIYAFGHPFLSIGVSDFPMNEGEVVTVLPSQASSFKLAYPTAMVGAMRGDRTPGIYGELGAQARMIPVEVKLKTSRGEQKTYTFEMVSDRFLTPILTQMMVISSITGSERTLGDATLQIRNRIQVKGQPEIVLENRLSTSMNAPLGAALAVSQPISALMNSGFSDAQIESVKLEVTSRDARNRGTLERLWISKTSSGQTEVKRGEQIELQVFARTENGSEYIERIPVEIPADAPLGTLQLTVSDGAALQQSEPRSGFTPKNTAQLVRELNKLRKADRLYVRLSRSDSGALVNNEEMPNLPPSVLATLGSERTVGGYSALRSFTVLEKELPPAAFVVSGQRTLTLTVVNQ